MDISSVRNNFVDHYRNDLLYHLSIELAEACSPHNRWGWFFSNQWFGLHLRWLFSNNFSTCLILVSNIDSIKFLQTEKIGFITRVPDLKINTGCHWFLFFQNNENDFMLLP